MVKDALPNPPSTRQSWWLAGWFVAVLVCGMLLQWWWHDMMTDIAMHYRGIYTFELEPDEYPVVMQVPEGYVVRRLPATQSGHWALFAIERGSRSHPARDPR